MKKNRNLKKIIFYIIIGKDLKGNWKLETDGIGSTVVPKTRFTREEAEEYCKIRNNYEGKEVFSFKKVELKL